MDRILLVEDDRNTLEGLAEILTMESYEVVKAIDGKSAVREMKSSNFNVLLTDLILPDFDGMELAKKSWEEQPDLMVVMMTAFGSVKHAVSSMKKGIFDYLTKPIDIDELLIVIKKAINQQKLKNEYNSLKDKIKEKYRYDNIVGTSGKMQEVFQKVSKIAGSDATVLIRGESGTGKELIARAIHYNSPRKNRELMEINCASIPETLLESELFGHEKGSFTGAHRMNKGKFESADGGTVFLDEIGDLSLNVQIKLLRFLQEKRFNRVGGSNFISVDIRLLAATNADLEAKMKAGKFREDLYYRLNVIPIYIPALKNRPEDIGPLIDHFIQKFSRKNEKEIAGITSEALNICLKYSWPGNVRELENAMENAVVLTENRFIAPEDLPFYLKAGKGGASFAELTQMDDMSYREQLEYAEKEIIRHALEETDGNKTHAAKRLGFSVRTMRNKVSKYGL
ncbi:MAG: sigma-54-dependent Fis family transcriptional regulator [Calditrichales bacterium]|nr:MAG: sigma-54-dependent Fis family transcriptional regulator [Calditrichales bacterium]